MQGVGGECGKRDEEEHMEKVEFGLTFERRYVLGTKELNHKEPLLFWESANNIAYVVSSGDYGAGQVGMEALIPSPFNINSSGSGMEVHPEPGESKGCKVKNVVQNVGNHGRNKDGTEETKWMTHLIEEIRKKKKKQR